MGVANEYENAHAESLNKSLKTQKINVPLYDCKVFEATLIKIFVEKYNIYRPHSFLKGMSPRIFENYLNIINKVK